MLAMMLELSDSEITRSFMPQQERGPAARSRKLAIA